MLIQIARFGAFVVLLGALMASCRSASESNECQVTPKMFCARYVSVKEHIPPKELEKIKGAKESELAEFHMSAGLAIRNSLRLWEDNDVTKFFRENGATEPDMMSRIMLVGLINDLNGRTTDMVATTRRIVAQLQLPPPPPPPSGS